VGTVYRATHLWTEREVAVKVLDPNLPHFDQLRDAFLREARATVQLDHPNVVDVLDMGEDGAKTTYLVMELLEGPTLRDVLLERGRLSPEDTLSILLPLIDALEKAHELGIVHRDFKPENIILSVDAFEATTPKLLDFGVAQLVRETRSRSLGAPDAVVVGTPQYMSPEQARDHRDLIGPHTDVWGVGIVLYECLTGRPPFDGDTALEVLTAVCEAPIDFDEIPKAHVEVLRETLRRSPKERIQSLSELRARLEERGLANPSARGNRGASVSSWPPPEKRPSHVRRTLQGAGSTDRALMGSRPERLDSELLSLPLTSHRKAALAGVAVAIAVGLAAWWTIGGTSRGPAVPPKQVISESTTALPAATAPPNDIGPTGNDHARDPVVPAPSPTASKPSPAASDPGQGAGEPGPPIEAVQHAAPDPSGASVRPASKASKPVRATQKDSTARERATPARDPGYEKLPDLVTEW
jgi:eukaryotic-like serine/threonine-protein kinase